MGWTPPPSPPRWMFRTEEGYQRALEQYKSMLGQAADRYENVFRTWALIAVLLAILIAVAAWKVLA